MSMITVFEYKGLDVHIHKEDGIVNVIRPDLSDILDNIIELGFYDQFERDVMEAKQKHDTLSYGD